MWPSSLFFFKYKILQNKVPEHYELLDYNTKMEPRGSKIPWLLSGIIYTPKYNSNSKYKINMHTWSYFTFDANW